MSELVLIRGLPGSGKSTLARKYAGYTNFEADQYFHCNGRYELDATLLDEAHRACLQKTRQALVQGCNVVVSNTFARRCELEPYFALGYPTRVVEARARFANVHGVSEEVVARLASQWESWPATLSSPIPVEPGNDSVSLWESLVGENDSIAAIDCFDFTPLPPLQDRVKLTSPDAEALESARLVSGQLDIPFWDAVIGSGLRPGGLSDALLDMVPLANPPHIVPTRMTRDEVLDGRLRGKAQGVEAGRVLALVSRVELRSGGAAHFPMLDFGCPVGSASEQLITRIGLRLLDRGGIVLVSGKSYHLVGRVPVSVDTLHRFLAQSLFYVPVVDRMYVAHHLLRGYCTLRISTALTQASAPIVVTVF